ncbi:MAG: bacillithiol biosynthesis cysteine-adding enzyme BshC [bacterium]|nr:bacillithiol biosynthesis cysteine-adding enzyme BshC [bacterium]
MPNVRDDYLAQKPDLLAFFERPMPSLSETPPHTRPWNPTFADSLRTYQDRIGTGATFRGHEAVVVTGQQPGLFTGPLYTIYKAVTAVRLAGRIAETTGTACIPVFWNGSEDHDFEEARSAHFLDRTHTPFTQTYSPEADIAGRPMYRVPVEASLHAAVDEAARRTTGSELADDVSTFLHESLDASDSLADWSARILARLFRDTGLVVFSPDLPEARRAAAELLAVEIAHPLESTRLLNEAGRGLTDLGYETQVVKNDTECGFFLEVEGRRRKVVFERGKYHLPGTGDSYTVDALHELLQTAPERFSPNVALRCIAQQWLFPAAAYVAGPGELAYWAQLKPLFAHFAEALPSLGGMPVVYPRAQAVLTSTKVRQLLDGLGLALDDFDQPEQTLFDRALNATVEHPGRQTLAEGRIDLETAADALTQRLEVDDAVAGLMARRLTDTIRDRLDRVDRTLRHRDQAQADAVHAQVKRLCNTIAPWRKPQERVYTVVSFLFQHGWGLIGRLLDELDIESFRTNEVEL